MARHDKLHQRLEALEADFIERVVPALVRAASGRGPDVFLSTRLRPVDYPRSVRSDVADELADAAETLVAVYGQLGIESAGTPASLYLAASHACCDYNNHHRGAPQGFAAKLLVALQSGAPRLE